MITLEDIIKKFQELWEKAKYVWHSYELYEITLIMAWYDLWVGVFVDTKKHHIYVFLLPCIGIKFSFLAVGRAARIERGMEEE